MNDSAAGLAKPLDVGGVLLGNRVFLAPMSGVTDAAFRKRAHAHGAGLVVSEMVASGELAKGSPKSSCRIRHPGLPVHMVQLAGREAPAMAEAARIAATSEPTVSRTRKALVEQLRKLVVRHAKADAIEDLPDGDDVTSLITSIWEENLFGCLKRSTLGSYALGVLDADWSDYARFHLETAGCDYCAAHLHDVQKGGQAISPQTRERILMSSAGFLR